MREVAFHCTNTDPSLMINGGFKSFEKGFNGENYAAHFYKRFLPENPMLVSSLGAPVWDYDTKFYMMIDITGLEKFPDFGHLLEYGAHLNEECF